MFRDLFDKIPDERQQEEISEEICFDREDLPDFFVEEKEND